MESDFSCVKDERLSEIVHRLSKLSYTAAEYKILTQIFDVHDKAIAEVRLSSNELVQKIKDHSELYSHTQTEKILAQAENARFIIEASTVRNTLSRLEKILSIKRSQQKVSKSASAVLLNWYEKNSRDPYPTLEEKISLAEESGMAIASVEYWFGNKRARDKRRQLRKQKTRTFPSNLCKEVRHGSNREDDSTKMFKMDSNYFVKTEQGIGEACHQRVNMEYESQYLSLYCGDGQVDRVSTGPFSGNGNEIIASSSSEHCGYRKTSAEGLKEFIESSDLRDYCGASESFQEVDVVPQTSRFVDGKKSPSNVCVQSSTTPLHDQSSDGDDGELHSSHSFHSSRDSYQGESSSSHSSSFSVNETGATESYSSFPSSDDSLPGLQLLSEEITFDISSRASASVFQEYCLQESSTVYDVNSLELLTQFRSEVDQLFGDDLGYDIVDSQTKNAKSQSLQQEEIRNTKESTEVETNHEQIEGNALADSLKGMELCEKNESTSDFLQLHQDKEGSNREGSLLGLSDQSYGSQIPFMACSDGFDDIIDNFIINDDDEILF